METTSRETGHRTRMKGLILAQSERWRRGLGMQVERERSNTSSVAKGVGTREQSALDPGIYGGNAGQYQTSSRGGIFLCGKLRWSRRSLRPIS
jgi:hypothetical protein